MDLSGYSGYFNDSVGYVLNDKQLEKLLLDYRHQVIKQCIAECVKVANEVSELDYTPYLVMERLYALQQN